MTQNIYDDEDFFRIDLAFGAEGTADIRGEIPAQTFLYVTTADRKFVDERIEMRLENEATRKFRCVLTGDNGGGIAPDHLRQVFLPFFTTKGDRHGTGLGLSIVKSIVDGHEGKIHVESQPGSGARFVLEIPAWHRV